jgi:hypothetical protein
MSTGFSRSAYVPKITRGAERDQTEVWHLARLCDLFRVTQGRR